MTLMIEATGVVKRFGGTTALDGLELSAEQGVILGAGKTTLVRCVATLLEPDAAALDGRQGVPADHPPRDQGFVTAAVVDPFGNVLGIMYNPHCLEILQSSGRA